MALRLKKLNEQVMVISGASSGIGLVTARMAAKCVARLVLSSRSEVELRELTEEINVDGGQAIASGPTSAIRRMSIGWRKQLRNNLADSIPGLTTPASRSMASSWKFPSKTCGAFWRPTSGGWSTVRWKRRDS